MRTKTSHPLLLKLLPATTLVFGLLPVSLHAQLLIHRAVELEIPTEPDTYYQIQISPDMVSWTDFGNDLVGTGAPVFKLVSTRTNDHAFYRCVASGTDATASALRARVEAFEAAWNTHQGSAIAAMFTEDAEMLFDFFPIVTGRDAVETAWNTQFASMEPTRQATITVESLSRIRPNVAVITISITTGGSGLTTRSGRGTWVMVRHSGEWQIAQMHGDRRGLD